MLFKLGHFKARLELLLYKALVSIIGISVVANYTNDSFLFQRRVEDLLSRDY